MSIPTETPNDVIRMAIAAGLGPYFANTARELASDVIGYLNKAGYTIIANDNLYFLQSQAALA